MSALYEMLYASKAYQQKQVKTEARRERLARLCFLYILLACLVLCWLLAVCLPAIDFSTDPPRAVGFVSLRGCSTSTISLEKPHFFLGSERQIA